MSCIFTLVKFNILKLAPRNLVALWCHIVEVILRMFPNNVLYWFLKDILYFLFSTLSWLNS